jgi:hypothetical protein
VRHLLVDGDGRISGVIDWGDVHLGHPGLDLSIVHGFLPPAAHDTFLRIYGPIDADTWRLARFRAFEYVMHLLRFGHETGDEDLVREADQPARSPRLRCRRLRSTFRAHPVMLN